MSTAAQQQQENKQPYSLPELEKMETEIRELRQAQMQAQTPQREKYWPELSIEEKIERTRVNVKNLAGYCDDLAEQLRRTHRTIRRLRLQIEDHSHEGMAPGRVTLPAAIMDTIDFGEAEEIRPKKSRPQPPDAEIYF